jgi:hypothetical protein
VRSPRVCIAGRRPGGHPAISANSSIEIKSPVSGDFLSRFKSFRAFAAIIAFCPLVQVESEDWTGPAFQTCVKAASTCRAFERSLRRDLLTFNHHKTLAALKLNPELVASLLDWCEAPLPMNQSARGLRLGLASLCRRQALRSYNSIVVQRPRRQRRRFEGKHDDGSSAGTDFHSRPNRGK